MLRIYVAMLIGVIFLLAAGCSEDGSTPEIIVRPAISQTSPQDQATDVNLNPLIRVWFDISLDESTIDSAAFYVEGANTYRLEYDDAENVVALYLADLLEPESSYVAVVDSSISSEAGNTMLSEFRFSFTTGPLDGDHLEDYLEPNDDVASAAHVELDTTYPLLTSSGGTERFDFYEFTLAESRKVTARAESVVCMPDTMGWIITFYRAEDEDYTWSSGTIYTGKDRAFGYTFLPGTYYVDTRKYDDDDEIVVYDLRLETTEPCQEDQYEDNDFFDEAAPITEGVITDLRGCYTDRDFFSIHLSEGETLTVTATQTTDIYATRRMKIYNPAEQSVADTTFPGQGIPTSRSWTALEDGTHYFKMRWWADGVSYDLDVDVAD